MTTRAARAAKYRRISDDREGRELGVTRQDEDLDALAERLGLVVVVDYADNDVSASTRSRRPRPRYQQLLRDARDGQFEVILAYTQGRLTRRPRENEDLIELAEHHGVRFAYVRSPSFDLNTANGRMIARILAAKDANEAEELAERVQRAARQRAERGQWHGGRVPPLGYELVRGEDERVVGMRLDPVWAPRVRDAADRLLKGESLYAVVADWNHRGITTREGARWVSATLRRALLSPSAVGRRESGGKLHETGWPELLDLGTWRRLHDLMRDRARWSGPGDGSYAGKRPLGGGVSVCDLCGKRLVSQVHRGKIRLVCSPSAAGGCGHVLVAYEPLERFVLDMVLARLDSPSFRARLVRRSTTTDTRESELREALSQVERRIRGVADALEVQAYTKAQAAERVRELHGQRDALQDRLTALARDHVLAEVETPEDARTLWAEADVSRRRRFIQSLVTEVRVGRFPEGKTTTLTRRRGESDDELQARRDEHERDVLRQRITIRWCR